MGCESQLVSAWNTAQNQALDISGQSDKQIRELVFILNKSLNFVP